jgi:hypothetical protein
VFTPPGAIDPHRIDSSPAEVAFGGTLEILGSHLRGDATALLLNHRDFDAPIAADAAWGLAGDSGRLTATVQPTIAGQAVLPGIYGAIVQTTARQRLPDGTQRDFDAASNESAFAIAPAIVAVNVAGAVLTIQVDSFEPHLLDAADLLVFAGTTRLARASTAVPAAGQFVTPSTPALKNTIRFAFPAGSVSGSVLPLRLIVRSAESAPWWESVQ